MEIVKGKILFETVEACRIQHLLFLKLITVKMGEGRKIEERIDFDFKNLLKII